MENVRYMLSQYRHETALYFGCRYMTPHSVEGYMAGGGYILSKKALSKFNEKILPNSNVCQQNEKGVEDLEMGNNTSWFLVLVNSIYISNSDCFSGKCLENTTIFVDTRDEKNQMTFFPLEVKEHLKPIRNLDFWYYDYLYYNVTQGSLDCCSENVAGLHYIEPQQMYTLDYFIYHVNPYGLELTNDKKPSKMPLKEILRRSNEKSSSSNYREHEVIREMEETEKIK